MYISASRQHDSVIVWEQRNSKNNLKTRKFPTPYECFIKVEDWKQARVKFKSSVEDGSPDSVLKDFIATTRDAIDTSTTYQSMFGDPLYKITFYDGRKWKNFLGKKPTDIDLWESDIPPELKVLSTNYYQAEPPTLNVTFYDIEVAYSPLRGFSSTMDPYAPLNSIAFYHVWRDEYVLYSVPPEGLEQYDPFSVLDYSLFTDISSKCDIKFFKTEADLLIATVNEIQDSDLMSGWNSALFDDPYLAQRIQMVLGDTWFNMLSFPQGKPPYFREVEIMFRMQKQVQFDGRITIDYLELFKKFTVEDRDSWNLESVSADHLGEQFKKLDYDGTLDDLYNGKYARVDTSLTSGGNNLLEARIVRECIHRELDARGLPAPQRKYHPSAAVDLQSTDVSALTDQQLLVSYISADLRVAACSFSKFIRYNLRDTEILKELDKKYRFISLGNQLIHQATCHFKNIVGTVRTAEMSINNYCWYELNKRVPDTKLLDEQGQAAGAYVLVPQTGMQEWIACFDINSLYPNVIRTVNISPDSLVGQFAEYESAWEAIFQQTSAPLSFRWETTGQVDTKPASEWREYLQQNKMSVSGYGTVFDQSSEGILPSILGKWYSDRKHYQKKAKETMDEIYKLKQELEELQAVS